MRAPRQARRTSTRVRNRTDVLARPTGVGRAGTHSGFKQILIEGADEWRSAVRESASLLTQVTPAPASGLLSSPSETAPAISTPAPSASSGPMVTVPILYQHRVVPLPQGIGTWTDTARETFLATDTLPWSFAAGDPAVAQ